MQTYEHTQVGDNKDQNYITDNDFLSKSLNYMSMENLLTGDLTGPITASGRPESPQ